MVDFIGIHLHRFELFAEAAPLMTNEITPGQHSTTPSPPSEHNLPPGLVPTNAPPRFSRKQLALAFGIAAIADAIGIFAGPLPPLIWVVDFVTVILLFIVLGWHWMLLPGLIMEAIPGVDILPFWLLVVGSIAVLGTVRPKLK